MTLSVAALGCAAPPVPLQGRANVATTAVETRLADVAVVDLDRVPRSVDGLRAGRVALVSLWATWCEACQAEFAALNRLDEHATGDKAVIIGVAVGEPSATVRGFVAEHGLKYAQLVDEEFQLADALGQRRLPATLIVSRTGEVVYVGGVLDADALSAFRRAMNE